MRLRLFEKRQRCSMENVFSCVLNTGGEERPGHILTEKSMEGHGMIHGQSQPRALHRISRHERTFQWHGIGPGVR